MFYYPQNFFLRLIQIVVHHNLVKLVGKANLKLCPGYALVGLRIVILTGGKTESVRLRYSNLGVEDVYMACAVKIKKYEEFLEKYGLHDDEIMYMGDDIPDYEIMQRVGCPVCPADACSDIKQLCVYISQRNGGCGCGRDVIEQVLRAQGKWLNGQKAFGW